MTNKNTKNKIIDTLFYCVIVVEGVLSLPQLIEILNSKSSQNVSIISWLGYALFSVVWLVYAKKQKDRPLLVYSIMSLVLDTVLVVAILNYK